MKVGTVPSFSEAVLVLLIPNKIKRILSKLGNVDFEILYICSNTASTGFNLCVASFFLHQYSFSCTLPLEDRLNSKT